MKHQKKKTLPVKKAEKAEEKKIDVKTKEKVSVEKIEEKVRRIPKKEEEKSKIKRDIIIGIILGLIIGVGIFIFYRNWISSAIAFGVVFVFSILYSYFYKILKESARIRKIESVFPDFLQLMSSNLRAGMTIDRAMLLSSREEFAPLDKEILNTGKDIATGKSIETALMDMSKRIGSEKIEKTILLIISGIRAGGNLAVLLEQTSVNVRERQFVEKKAASNVLMYVIFIFIAVSVGAPVLFSLSGILVETLTNLIGSMPTMETTAQMSLPFTLSSVNISTTFVKYFSLVFILFLDILAALIMGLVNKGEEKEGLKYLIPLLLISFGIFFLVRILLSGFISGLIG